MITTNVRNNLGKTVQRGLGQAGLILVSISAWLGTAVHAAVNDLPGGPAVNQLNLHPAVTRVAEDQAWLHWFMLAICLVIFLGVLA